MQIHQLTVSVENREIVKNLSLDLPEGSTRVLMGPNGSGKSTLAYALAGHYRYTITTGSVLIDGCDIVPLAAHQRAQKGLFLAFQNPVALPGVRVSSFLYEAYQILKQKIGAREFNLLLADSMSLLGIDPAFMHRSMNEGFSGGERKRFELLQLLIFEPRTVILDEIDSGLDVDGLRLIALVINRLKAANPATAVLIITHYPRIFEYIVPDRVFIMSAGRLVDQGGMELVHAIGDKGYSAYVRTE